MLYNLTFTTAVKHRGGVFFSMLCMILCLNEKYVKKFFALLFKNIVIHITKNWIAQNFHWGLTRSLGF